MLFVDFPPVGEITKIVKQKNLKRIFTGLMAETTELTKKLKSTEENH